MIATAPAIAAAFHGGFSLGVICGVVLLYIVATVVRIWRDRA